MPPKKKPKGKGPKDDDDKESLEGQNKTFNGNVQLLQVEIVNEQERADKSEYTINKLRGEITTLSKDLQKEQDTKVKTVNEMRSDYKSMQGNLMGNIDELEMEVKELEKGKQEKEETLSRLKKEMQEELANKDDEIKELQNNMEKMSSEFAIMLKETLEKMQQRIELANTQWENEHEAMMNRGIDKPPQ